MAFLTMNDGRKLFYEDEGAGQPVVFLHGWKASANVYAEPCRLMAERCRCIRYDHCGHLRSDSPENGPDLGTLADDLREVITQLDLKAPVLVGWSMGGMTVLEYLRRYGCGNIEKIVLVDIGPYKMTAPEILDREVALARTDFHEFMRQYYTIRVPGFAALTTEAQDECITQRMEGHHPTVLTALWAAFSRRDHRDVLPKITCPAAIFYAGRLPVCDEETARYYRDCIPAPTKIVCFRDHSHNLITEAPERFAEELRAFLA